MTSRHILTTASAFALLLLSVYVTVLAVADILDSRADATIRSWGNSEKNQVIQSWNETLTSLQLAQLLDPLNSEVYEKQGQLYRFNSFAYPQLSDKNIKANEQALMLFKQAAERRPTWAPFWATIIQTKLAMWLYDEELERAIINAAQSGPWFGNVQPAVLNAGGRGWPELGEEARQAVIKVLHSAVVAQPRQAISIALNSGLIDYAMPVIEQDPELKKVYRQIQASRKRKAKQQMKKLVK